MVDSMTGFKSAIHSQARGLPFNLHQRRTFDANPFSSVVKFSELLPIVMYMIGTRRQWLGEEIRICDSTGDVLKASSWSTRQWLGEDIRDCDGHVCAPSRTR
jgi:hypothetical protein